MLLVYLLIHLFASYDLFIYAHLCVPVLIYVYICLLSLFNYLVNFIVLNVRIYSCIYAGI